MLCVSFRPSSSMLFPFLVCVSIIHPSDSILKVIYQLVSSGFSQHLHDTRGEFNTSINPQLIMLCLSENYRSIFQRVKADALKIFGWL